MPSVSEFEKEEPTRPDILHPPKPLEPSKEMVRQGDATQGEVGDVSVYVGQPTEIVAAQAQVLGQPFVKGGLGGPGRKSLLTPELQKDLFGHLEQGTPVALCCRLVGIDMSTISRWRTLEKAGDRPDLTRFFIDYMHSRALGELHMVNVALRGDGREYSHGPAKSAQWLLERAFGHAYAPRTTMKIEEVGSLTMAAVEKVCSQKDCGCYEALLGVLQELAEARDNENSVD